MSTDEITPGERRELRSVVRTQFEVLRGEVKQREQELKTDIARQVVEAYADADRQLAEANVEVARILRETSREIGEVLERFSAVGSVGRAEIIGPRLAIFDDHRSAQVAHAEADLKERVAAARLKLDRQEADLLRELSIGALGTDQARAFLDQIPSVSSLVPAARLAELESQFGPDE